MLITNPINFTRIPPEQEVTMAFVGPSPLQKTSKERVHLKKAQPFLITFSEALMKFWNSPYHITGILWPITWKYMLLPCGITMRIRTLVNYCNNYPRFPFCLDTSLIINLYCWIVRHGAYSLHSPYSAIKPILKRNRDCSVLRNN